MENEQYQEFIKKPRNKLALVMWLLINNNVVHQNTYMAMMALDFGFSVLVILCLYNQVGAITLISSSVTSILDFDIQPTLEVVNIAVAAIMFAIVSLIVALVFIKLPWTLYSSKRLILQVVSLVVTMIMQPLFGILCLIILDGFFNFNWQLQYQIAQGGSTSNNFTGFIAGIISTVGLVEIQYFGAYVFNLSVPNAKIPWSCMSHQPAILQAFLKLLLMLTFNVRGMSPILLYAMALITTLVSLLRIYILIYRANILNTAIFKTAVIFECAQFHLLFYFLPTCILNSQPSQYYIICAVTFLPATCLLGLYFQRRFSRNLIFDSIVQEGLRKTAAKDNGEELLLAYHGLVSQCIDRSENTKQDLIMLEQAHNTRCMVYFDMSFERISANDFCDQSGLLSLMPKLENAEETGGKEVSLPDDSEIPFEGSQKNLSFMNVVISKRKLTSFSQTKESSPESRFQKIKQAANMFIRIGTQTTSSQPIDQSKLRNPPIMIDKMQVEEEIKQDDDNRRNRKFSERNKEMNTFESNSKSTNLQNKRKTSDMNVIPDQQQKESLKIDAVQKLKYDLEKRSSGREDRWVSLRQLVNHLFNYHSPENSKSSFKLKLLKVYFTFHVMNNPYLARFQMCQKQYDSDDLGFIDSNLSILHYRYFDDLLLQQSKQLEESVFTQNKSANLAFGQVDLRNILSMNQLLVEFENLLETICERIHLFWENLLTSSNTQKVFVDGIQISEKLTTMLRLLNRIQEQQSNFETKTYIQMAQFYQLVVFKPIDSYVMIEKAKQAVQSKNLQKRGQGGLNSVAKDGVGQNSNEKCLVMARINANEPMKVEFFNKNALKLLCYQSNKVENLTINQIMPRFVADYHQHFVDQFMMTGNSRMLNNTREMFAKQSSGCLVPVLTNVFVNSMSRNHVVLIFEENFQMQIIDSQYAGKPWTFLLASRDFEFGEISSNFQKITGVSQKEIQILENEFDRTLEIDDFIMIQNQESEVRSLRDVNSENAEVQVIFHNVRQNFSSKKQLDGSLEESENSEMAFQQEDNKQINSQKSQQNTQEIPSHSNESHQYTFMMRIQDLKFMGGKFVMKLILLRRIPRTLQNMMLLDQVLDTITKGISRRSDLDVTTNKNQGKYAINYDEAIKNDFDDMSGDSTNPYEMGSQISQSSASNSSMSGARTILSAYSQQTNSSNSPKTLKFLINLVLIIVLTMIISSSVVLSLATSSLTFAYNAIFYSQSPFQTYDESSLTKLMWRGLANIEHGYVPSTGPYLPDRYKDYRMMLFIQRREMRDDVNSIVQNQAEEGQLATEEYVCWSISETGDIYNTTETLGTGLALVNTKSGTLIAEDRSFNSIGNSVMPLYNLEISLDILLNSTYVPPLKQKVTQIEQDVFYILNNTNGILQQPNINFGPIYIQMKLDEIQSKLNFLTGTSLGVIVLIVLSGFLILPLTGTIQTRISELMKLFFSIDLNQKREILKKIKEFQQVWFSQKSLRKRISENSQMHESVKENSKTKIAVSLRSVDMIKMAGKDITKPKRKRLNDLDPKKEMYVEGSDQPLPSPTPLLGKKGPSRKIAKAFNAQKSKFKNALMDVQEHEEEDNTVEESYDNHDEDQEEVKHFYGQDEESESENEQKSKKHKKRKHKKENERKDENRDGEPNAYEQASQEIYASQIEQFSKYINTRKVGQSIIIIFVLLVMCSYFITMYILSNQYFTLALDTKRDFQATFSRFTCHLNIITLYTESFYQGTNFTKERFQAINDQITLCMQAEQNYKDYIVGSTLPYMSTINPLVNLMESGVVCPMQTEQSTTPDFCLAMQAQLIHIGFPAYLYGFMQTIQQMLLNLQNALNEKEFEIEFAKNQLSTLHDYIDMMIDIFYPNHVNIENSIVQGTSDYFMQQQPIVNAIFASYFSVIVIFTILQLIYIILVLKKEMIQSNRMLYIIDFENLSEEERQKILKFLLKH